MVPVSLYLEHIFPVAKELIDFCEKELNIIIWMHNSETEIEHIKEQMNLGAGIMSIGPDGDINKIRHLTKGKQPISGNLDPIKVLMERTPESISTDVERIMKICKPGGGFVFNTGEMNPRMVPEENMDAYMFAAKRLSDY
jgi:uroporphyrinogen-III decarboxylase